MRRLAVSCTFLAAIAVAQTVQGPSPKQGRPGEILPWTRFRPRTEAYSPTAEEKQQIQAKIDRLGAMIRDMRARRVDDSLLVDVEIFHEAARWIMVFPEEFFNKNAVAHTLHVLDMGLERAAQLKDGKSPWLSQKGRLMRGYRSAIDGSVQPFQLTIPDDYDGSRPVPLDVVEHGRQVSKYEVEFISSFAEQGANRPYLPGTIQVGIFGRGNNTYQWPGEADIFETIDAVKKAYKIDLDRVALRGFSMGGAGVWHTALHQPDLWATVEEGAGDNESHRMPALENLAAHQQATCHIFDNMYEWALNTFNTPFVAYVGEIDGTFRNHVLVRQQLAKEGFHLEGLSFTTGLRVLEIPTMMFLVAPNTPHATDPEFRKRMDAFALANLKRGRQDPNHIRFLTYTTRYNRSYWVTLDGLEKHYDRAEVDAKRSDDRAQYEIATKNLSRLILREADHAESIQIDGRKLSVKRAPEITLEKSGGSWGQTDGSERPGLRKKHGQQGPIDDAFLEPFLVVRPTGVPWNAAANRQALHGLHQFEHRYPLAYRGHIRVKDDTAVTESDFEKYHVVLFGDPGSNRWIAKLNGKLPLTWTKQTVTMGSRTFSAAETLPALIYPSPLSPSTHYVVLNSGITANWEDWAGDFPTPQYGDFAILRVNEMKDSPDVAYAGLFDESWKLP
jgi:hypothetical protein